MNTIRLDHASQLASFTKEDLAGLAASKDGFLHIALPGGRSAAYLVQGLLQLHDQILRRVRLYLVDERLEGERNLDTLLEAGLGQAIAAKRMSMDQIRIPVFGERLSDTGFDRVYLGVGEDGHIASLFPGSWPDARIDQVILVEDSPKQPKRRATLSYSGLSDLTKRARIHLLFLGESKGEALKRFGKGVETAETLPCAFFLEYRNQTTIITDLKEETT